MCVAMSILPSCLHSCHIHSPAIPRTLPCSCCLLFDTPHCCCVSRQMSDDWRGSGRGPLEEGASTSGTRHPDPYMHEDPYMVTVCLSVCLFVFLMTVSLSDRLLHVCSVCLSVCLCTRACLMSPTCLPAWLQRRRRGILHVLTKLASASQ